LAFLPAPDRPPSATGEVHVWRLELQQPQRSAFGEALREVLARYLGAEPGEIELVVGERGKPRLAGGQLHFNLSHSGALGLVAVCAEREVGVDVERLRPKREAAFYWRWAQHEARLKCLGTGLGAPPPPDSPPVAIQPLEVAPGYAAAVAAVGSEPPPLRCWTFDQPLLRGGWRVS
jgi:phosphopantetheinyl transferase